MNNSSSQDLSRVLRTRREACTHRCPPPGRLPARHMVLSPGFAPPVLFDSPLTIATVHEGRVEWSMFQLYGGDRAPPPPRPELSRGERQWRGMCLGLFDGESPALKKNSQIHILSRRQWWIRVDTTPGWERSTCLRTLDDWATAQVGWLLFNMCVRACVCIWDSLHHILDSAPLVHLSTRTEGQVQSATRSTWTSTVVPSCLCLGVWSAHLHKVDMLNECARERACCVGSGNPASQREQMAALTKVKWNTQAQQPPLKTHGLLWATLLLRTETIHQRVLSSARIIR